MSSASASFGGPAKNATRFETPLCTRSAASSDPALPESTDKTTKSADATASSTTSAHPAARRTGSLTERTATIANTANANTTRTAAHLSRREIIIRFIGLLHKSAMSPACEHRPYSAKMSSPVLAHHVISVPRNYWVAFGVKRTSTRGGHKTGFMSTRPSHVNLKFAT